MIGEHGRIKLPWIMGEEPTRRQKWKKVQYLAIIFLTRWIKEYIQRLQERQKWLKQRRNLQPGDLVLINQCNSPRNQWPLGRVVKAHTSADGLVHSVDVKTSAGVYERPVNKLCFIRSVNFRLCAYITMRNVDNYFI